MCSETNFSELNFHTWVIIIRLTEDRTIFTTRYIGGAPLKYWIVDQPADYKQTWNKKSVHHSLCLYTVTGHNLSTLVFKNKTHPFPVPTKYHLQSTLQNFSLTTNNEIAEERYLPKRGGKKWHHITNPFKNPNYSYNNPPTYRGRVRWCCC